MEPIIYEYEEVLLGKKAIICLDFFQKNAKELNEKQALAVFRYAFEVYLRWSPIQIRENITKELLEKMKLTQLIRYLQFPAEINPEKDCYYIANIMYPYLLDIDFKKNVLHVFKESLKNKEKLPKEFLSEAIGEIRANICMQYILSEKMYFETTEELYYYFYSKKGIQELKKYKLYGAIGNFYNSPLEFMHFSLPQAQKNEFLYHYYLWKTEKEEMCF